MAVIPTPDTTFDICFSEASPEHVLAAGGDTTLKLYSVQGGQPLAVLKGHMAEV